MQVADGFAVIDMLDGAAIKRLARQHKPDFVVPEIEAIRTEALLELERAGTTVIPSAMAAHLTMNRDAIRSLAAEELGLPTARFAYANSEVALREAILGIRDARAGRTGRGASATIGLPCVIKPVMSSSGKGQSVARTPGDIAKAWKYALKGMRGDKQVVIVEEFIDFDYEITLLTVKQRRSAVKRGHPGTIFVDPIGHRQERGDYQESWMPCPMKPALVREARRMAKAITDRIAGPEGAGIFGVEFFVKENRVIFSELSPRPHDTGMVTMISQDLSEFELHLRAVLGLPIPRIVYRGPSASAVILAECGCTREPAYRGVEDALAIPGVEVRIFGKPSLRKYRRMGVALATGKTVKEARATAARAAGMVKVVRGRRARGKVVGNQLPRR